MTDQHSNYEKGQFTFREDIAPYTGEYEIIRTPNGEAALILTLPFPSEACCRDVLPFISREHAQLEEIPHEGYTKEREAGYEQGYEDGLEDGYNAGRDVCEPRE